MNSDQPNITPPSISASGSTPTISGRGRLGALHHLVVAGLRRVDARVRARPQRRLVVERVELDAAVRRLAQLADQQVDELVLVDDLSSRSGVRRERRPASWAATSPSARWAPCPARAPRLVLVGGDVVDHRHGRDASRCRPRGSAFAKSMNCARRHVAVACSRARARPLVALVVVVAAGVGRVVLPVVGGLAVAAHARARSRRRRRSFCELMP